MPEILHNKRLIRPVIVTDKTVEKAIAPYLPKAFLTDNPLVYFKGNCTFEEIDRLCDILAPYDSIITFVGGQLIDTVKVVSDKLNIFLINIQTLPSNCAALTSKSIIYASSTHEKIANKRQQKPVDMVLIEPELLRRAPKAYIVSGIGDTLAKYYEIRRRLTLDKTIHVTAAIGRFYIETCRKITLSLEDFNEISDIEWHNALDTIFLVAASVDGIADQDGRSVGAYAFHNAYVKVIEGRRPTHGEI
ncbi:iron-containing alcohol dehydrogenase, partial [Streptococcus pluranimalium]